MKIFQCARWGRLIFCFWKNCAEICIIGNRTVLNRVVTVGEARCGNQALSWRNHVTEIDQFWTFLVNWFSREQWLNLFKFLPLWDDRWLLRVWSLVREVIFGATNFGGSVDFWVPFSVARRRKNLEIASNRKPLDSTVRKECRNCYVMLMSILRRRGSGTYSHVNNANRRTYVRCTKNDRLKHNFHEI